MLGPVQRRRGQRFAFKSKAERCIVEKRRRQATALRRYARASNEEVFGILRDEATVCDKLARWTLTVLYLGK